MNNNNNWLVDNPSSNNGMDQAQEYLLQDEKAPVEVSQPSISPQPFFPDNSVVQEYGEYELQGINRSNDYENFEQWESRMQEEHRRSVIDGGIWNRKLTTSGAPFINEEKHSKKSSPERVAELNKQQDINDIQQRLVLLQQSSARLQKDL